MSGGIRTGLLLRAGAMSWLGFTGLLVLLPACCTRWLVAEVDRLTREITGLTHGAWPDDEDEDEEDTAA